MSDLKAQIAHILEREFEPLGPRTQFDAIAEVLIADLKITQEWGLRGAGGVNVHWKSDDRDEVRALEGDHPFSELVERDVMPWQPDRWRTRPSVGS